MQLHMIFIAAVSLLVLQQSSSEELSCQLKFVDVINIKGCPVFVHERTGSLKGNYVLEPLFCAIYDSDLYKIRTIVKLLRTTNHIYSYSMWASNSTNMYPLQLTESFFEKEAMKQLSNNSDVANSPVKSVQFMNIWRVAAKANRSGLPSLIPSASFTWIIGESVGYLRLKCDCPVGANLSFTQSNFTALLARQQFHLMNYFSIVATTSVPGCPEMTREYPVSVANRTTPIKYMQRYQPHPDHQQCHLNFVRTFKFSNCTAALYQRMDKSGHYVLEPLLCFTGYITALQDVSGDANIMKKMLRLKLVDVEILKNVTAEIQHLRPESVTFMKLRDANVTVMETGSELKFESISLSPDRTLAEIVLSPDVIADKYSHRYTGTFRKMQLIQLFSRLSWSVMSEIPGFCQFKSMRNTFGLHYDASDFLVIDNLGPRNYEWPENIWRNIDTDTAIYYPFIAPKRKGRSKYKEINSFCLFPPSATLTNIERDPTNFISHAYFSEWKFGSFYYKKNVYFSNVLIRTSNYGWIGLDALHTITNSRRYGDFKFVVMDDSNEGDFITRVKGVWSNFKIASEKDRYRLTIGAMDKEKSTEGLEDFMAAYNGSEFQFESNVPDVPHDYAKCPGVEFNKSWWVKNCNTSLTKQLFHAGHLTFKVGDRTVLPDVSQKFKICITENSYV